MPRKRSGLATPHPARPSVPPYPATALTFTIDTCHDPETGKPALNGSFSRDWLQEEALDVLIEQANAGQISPKQALTRARKLEAVHPDNLEIQNFIANQLWDLDLREEAAQVHERAFNRAAALIAPHFKGEIPWGDLDNRSFLRLAHGTLLGFMHRRQGDKAMALARQLLAWCPMDNLGVRYLLGDIALLQGDRKAAMRAYLENAPESPALWYQAALIALREGDYVPACTYLRRGIADNPYIAEGLTGRTTLLEHHHWHASNVNRPDWAIDYLESPACDWTPEERDFVDWVFNASPVLKERADRMALHETLSHERSGEKRAARVIEAMGFVDRITDAVSKKMVVKVCNRFGVEVWPWDRNGLS